MAELQATSLLRRDVAVAESVVLRLVKVPLTQGQFDALVDSFRLPDGAYNVSFDGRTNEGQEDCRKLGGRGSLTCVNLHLHGMMVHIFAGFGKAD